MDIKTEELFLYSSTDIEVHTSSYVFRPFLFSIHITTVLDLLLNRGILFTTFPIEYVDTLAPFFS